jgi:hypothetical protein
MSKHVIPAKAGIPGQVAAGLAGTPAFAGVTD